MGDVGGGGFVVDGPLTPALSLRERAGVRGPFTAKPNPANYP
jgi:hypothetical protein